MSSWIEVAKLSDLPESEMVPVDHGGTAVILIRRGPAVFAYEDRCPHVDYPLSVGYIDGDEIVCTFHGACFAITNGEIRCPPADGPLTAVAVRIEADSVQLEQI